ncbi:MAG: hypothetical protein RBU23_13600 [Candidatus Auribacterota bacterium]|jgi:hypothetical protein|nr:hypothetical protein [Candidatus Auribacterota bacterium]
MKWSDVIQFRASLVEGIDIQIGGIGLIILVGLCVASVYLWRKHLRGWSASEFEVNLGRIGKVKIRRNNEVACIAHRAWTELQTRKASLPFDENYDVISEVYDSWYSLFKEFRELIKSIPADHIATDKDTEKLVNLMVAVLNDGLRPHLTKWQAKFRRWFNYQIEKRKEDCPQDIQKDFPQYNDLVKELIELNSKLQEYSNFLRKVAHNH